MRRLSICVECRSEPPYVGSYRILNPPCLARDWRSAGLTVGTRLVNIHWLVDAATLLRVRPHLWQLPVHARRWSRRARHTARDGMRRPRPSAAIYWGAHPLMAKCLISWASSCTKPAGKRKRKSGSGTRPDWLRYHPTPITPWAASMLRAAMPRGRRKRLPPPCERNPAYLNAYYGLGNACYELRDFERAVSTYRQALALNPQDYELWNNLGRALEALLRTEEALAAYERAIEIQPQFGLARSNRALTLLSLGRLQEGFREYEWRWRKTPPRPYRAALLARPTDPGENACWSVPSKASEMSSSSPALSPRRARAPGKSSSNARRPSSVCSSTLVARTRSLRLGKPRRPSITTSR